MVKVTLIGKTEFQNPGTGGWVPTDTGPSGIIEFAGRNCYQSWDKPNPKTARTGDYIQNIIKQGHLSVLEHASASFFIEDVSRSLTHELVRHRHLSFSQLSQRYCDGSSFDVVMGFDVGQVAEARSALTLVERQIGMMYQHVFMAVYDNAEGSDSTRRRRATQAARAVLPNAAATKIVVSGNMRSWREFIIKRGSLGADYEIRELAITILEWLTRHFPAVFSDLTVRDHEDGSQYIEETACQS